MGALNTRLIPRQREEFGKVTGYSKIMDMGCLVHPSPRHVPVRIRA
jgi:hypothetical protein